MFLFISSGLAPPSGPMYKLHMLSDESCRMVWEKAPFELFNFDLHLLQTSFSTKTTSIKVF